MDATCDSQIMLMTEFPFWLTLVVVEGKSYDWSNGKEISPKKSGNISYEPKKLMISPK